MYQIEARKAFYRVVDRDPEPEIAPQAMVQVGLTLLTEGHPLEAMIPLRQALALATTTPSRAEAVLALSAGCLLAGNPQETAKILAANRQCTNQDPWRTTAVFLGGFARYRIALASKNSRLESGEFLTTVLGFQNHFALGCVGRLLAGQAYQELGLPQQMALIYENGLSAAVGPVAEEMPLWFGRAFLEPRQAGAGIENVQGDRKLAKR